MPALLTTKVTAVGGVGLNLVAWIESAATGDSGTGTVTTVGTLATMLGGLALHYVIAQVRTTWAPALKEWLAKRWADRERIRSESVAGKYDALIAANAAQGAQLEAANLILASQGRQLVALAESGRAQVDSLVRQLEAVQLKNNDLVDRNHRLARLAAESPEWRDKIERAIGEVNATTHDSSDGIKKLTESVAPELPHADQSDRRS